MTTRNYVKQIWCLLGEKHIGIDVESSLVRLSKRLHPEFFQSPPLLRWLGDPVWEVLYPEEQSRVLELLVETVTVSKASVDIHFRANGIEQIVGELNPMSERADG